MLPQNTIYRDSLSSKNVIKWLYYKNYEQIIEHPPEKQSLTGKLKIEIRKEFVFLKFKLKDISVVDLIQVQKNIWCLSNVSVLIKVLEQCSPIDKNIYLNFYHITWKGLYYAQKALKIEKNLS